MTWLVVGDIGDIPFYVPPHRWAYGEEKRQVHALVAADGDAVETLWSVRTSPEKMARFLLERSAPFVAVELARRTTVDEDELADVIDYLRVAIPDARVPARADQPALAWQKLRLLVRRCRDLRAMEPKDARAMLAIMEGKLAQLAPALADPSRMTVGAAYDRRRALVEDAVATTVVQPVVDLGIREDAGELSAAGLAMLHKPAARALRGLESYWLVDRAAAQPLGDRVAELGCAGQARSGDELDGASAALERLAAALARVDGMYLMSLTRWRDAIFAPGSEISRDDLRGILRRY